MREVFDDSMYKQTTGADGKVEYRCAVALDTLKTDPTIFLSNFSTFSAFYGARYYTSDTAFTTVHDSSFTFTLTKPTYEFGDEFEFEEAPQAVEGFKASVTTDLALIDATKVGVKGFAKMQGDYNIIPNFDSLMWQFTFSLEMPTDMFKPGNWVFFEASYVPKLSWDSAADIRYITCGVEVGNPLSAEVKEYGNTYSFGGNANVATDDDGWKKNFNLKNYNLVETINGKSRQNCAAMIDLDAEYVDSTLAGLTFTAQFAASWSPSKNDALITVSPAAT